jgi:clan AA aspartic protease (TIGR02281 family)
MRETRQDSDGPLRWAIGKAIVVLIVGVVAAMIINWSDQDPATGKERVSAVGRPLNTRSSEEGIDAGRTLVVQADQQGHFWVDGEINGVSIPFMIDTGATSVALDRETAARIGIRPSAREFTGRSNTANGMARVAPVTLRQLSIGQMTVRDVQAHVLEGSMHGMGLLGMSFLRRLDAYEVRGDRLPSLVMHVEFCRDQFVG